MFEGSDCPSKVASLVFTRLVACLADLQSLPTDDEYRYFAQFPEFRRITHDLKSRAFRLLESVTSPAHFAAGLDGAADEARTRLSAIKKSLSQRGEDCKVSAGKLQLRFEEPVNNSVRVFVPADSQWRKLAAAMSCPILCEETIPKSIGTTVERQVKAAWKSDSTLLVDTVDKLHSVCGRIAGCKEIGVFAVYQSERCYRGFTRALAISTREEEFVIDAVALRGHVSDLQALFSNGSVLKVMHRAEDWGKALARDLGIAAVNSFDLSKAAKALKLPSATLSFLCKSYCGHEVDPQFSTIDWNCDSLTHSHIAAIKSCLTATLRLYDLLKEDLELKVGPAAAQSVVISKPDLLFEKDDVEQKGPMKKLIKWRRGLARMTDQREDAICPDEYLRKWCESPPTSVLELQSVNQYVRAAASFIIEITKKQQKRGNTSVKHSSDVFERVGWKAAVASSETSFKNLLDKTHFSELHIESLFGADSLPSDAARGLSILSKMKKVGRLPYLSLVQEVETEEAESSYWDERRIPASIEDIYELSNANRKKAKKGKMGCESAPDTPAAPQRLGDVQSLFKQLGWGVLDPSPRTKSL